MRIGRLNARVVVQQGTQTKDPQYGKSVAIQWVDYRNLWVEPVAVSGSEEIEAMAIVGKQTMRFRARARNDITPKMRLIYKGQPWDISVIAPEGYDRKFMVITAVRGLTSGQ